MNTVTQNKKEKEKTKKGRKKDRENTNFGRRIIIQCNKVVFMISKIFFTKN